MDFSWTEKQLARQAEVIAFAQQALNPDLLSHDRDGVFARESWQKCADFGILGLAIPRQYGGSETDLMTVMLLMEGLGYGCRDNGLPFGLNSQMWSVQPSILTFGSEDQKANYLPRLVSGAIIGAYCMTEPTSGSDAYGGMEATARRVDGGFVLNGTKHLITFGPIADIAVFFARTNPELGNWGISAFIVEKGMPGFEQSPVRDKMGLRTIPIGEITLQDCFVPLENQLGPEGAGMSIFNHSMEWERSFVLVSQLGQMAYQLDECIRFAGEREQGGRPIGSYQSVSNRIAEMKLRLEISRLLLYRVAWLKQTDQPMMAEAAMAKWYMSEAFVHSSLDAVRIHGGRGYLTQYEIERNLRDATGGLIYSGTTDIQRNLIARQLGL